jgi:hypothetical protein
VPWLTAAILHCVNVDKHTNPQRIAGLVNRHRESVKRRLEKMKRMTPRLLGERGETLYLTNTGRGMLEQAQQEGWSVDVFEVVEEDEKG